MENTMDSTTATPASVAKKDGSATSIFFVFLGILVSAIAVSTIVGVIILVGSVFAGI
jgi:hypothetical protein